MTLTVYAIDGVTPVVDPTAYVHPTRRPDRRRDRRRGLLHRPGGVPARRLRPARGPRRREHPGHLRAARFPGTDTIVEEDGHIGHGAILHGCIVERNALVGMNAVVNDNAVIGESAIVAAMAFVKAGMIVPPRTLVVGRAGEGPARADRRRARVEDRGHAELPGAHAALPRDDARDRAAAGDGAGPQAASRLPEMLPLAALKAKRADTRRERAFRDAASTVKPRR